MLPDTEIKGDDMAGNNFKDDPQKASEAGKKGGEHSRGSHQQDQSHQHSGQQGGASSSGQRGGSHEQHVEAGKQSHKNR